MKKIKYFLIVHYFVVIMLTFLTVHFIQICYPIGSPDHECVWLTLAVNDTATAIPISTFVQSLVFILVFTSMNCHIFQNRNVQELYVCSGMDWYIFKKKHFNCYHFLIRGLSFLSDMYMRFAAGALWKLLGTFQYFSHISSWNKHKITLK